MSARVRLNLPLAVSPKSRVVAGVVARLKAQIEGGELRGGDQLPPERELARELKVSRPSVRRAIAFLSAVGVIDIRHGSGTFVATHPGSALRLSPLSLAAARHSKSELREARLFLSAAIAKLAALRASDGQLSQLAEDLIGMHRSLSDRNRFSAHIEGFHCTLQSAAGNAALSSLLHSTVPGNDQFRELAPYTKDPQHLAGLHHSLYVAIRGHDCSLAPAAMMKLLRSMYRDAARVHTMDARRPSLLPRVFVMSRALDCPHIPLQRWL
jgi:GntR family transcriptional regulator, transcriptional repressor for pyruvate dehydrogenase complex